MKLVKFCLPTVYKIYKFVAILKMKEIKLS